MSPFVIFIGLNFLLNNWLFYFFENKDVNFAFGIFIHSNFYIINERIETIKTIHKDWLINFFFDINFILFFLNIDENRWK